MSQQSKPGMSPRCSDHEPMAGGWPARRKKRRLPAKSARDNLDKTPPLASRMIPADRLDADERQRIFITRPLQAQTRLS